MPSCTRLDEKVLCKDKSYTKSTQEDLKIPIKQPVLQGTVALESFWLLTSALGGAFGGSFYGYTESRENWDVFASQPFMAFAEIYNLPVQ